jgi:hypothetical protein
VFDVLFCDDPLEYGNNPSELAQLPAASLAWQMVALPLVPPYGWDQLQTIDFDAAQDRVLLLDDTAKLLAVSGSGSGAWLTAADYGSRLGAATCFDPVARHFYVSGGSRNTGSMPSVETPLLLSTSVDAPVVWNTSTGGKVVVSSARGAELPAWLGGFAAPASAQADSLPRARFGQAQAVDPLTNVLWMYGGQATDGTGDVLSDLWMLPPGPGGKWTRVFTANPTPGYRRYAQMFWDAPRSRFLLIGGDDTHVRISDAWELRVDGAATWRQLSIVGTMPSSYQEQFPDMYDGTYWVISNTLTPITRMTIGLDALTYEVVTPTGSDLPSIYFYGVDFAGFDPVQRKMYWFPDHGGYLSELYRLVTTTLSGLTSDWQVTTTVGPTPSLRAFMSSRVDTPTSRIIISGGEYDNGPYFADTWALQLPITLPTATLISVETALSEASGVQLRWHVSAAAGTTCTVERSSDGSAWSAAGVATWTGADEVTFADAALASGTREAYRLQVGAGADATRSAAVWLDAASTGGAAMAIAPLTSPSRGLPTLRLSLRADAPAHVRMLDVSGRVVSEANVAPGTQRWSPASAPAPGLYFAELVQGRDRRIARIVVAP